MGGGGGGGLEKKVKAAYFTKVARNLVRILLLCPDDPSLTRAIAESRIITYVYLRHHTIVTHDTDRLV